MLTRLASQKRREVGEICVRKVRLSGREHVVCLPDRTIDHPLLSPIVIPGTKATLLTLHRSSLKDVWKPSLFLEGTAADKELLFRQKTHTQRCG